MPVITLTGPRQSGKILPLWFINQIRNKKSATETKSSSAKPIRNLLQQPLLLELIYKIGDIVLAALLQDVTAVSINGMNAQE